MAAFSYSHSSFLLDSSVLFLPNNTPIQVPEFSEEPNNISTSTCTAQFYDDESLTKKQSSDSSSVVVDQNPQIGNQFTKRRASMDKKRKNRDGSPSTTTAQSMRITKKRNSKGGHQKEKKPTVDRKIQKKKAPEDVKITGYVHVRARRGEATDSHSLAERARREKISERMKLLQSLVPGCDKITGKAFVLDEIISYVQSLQTQVEFLTMKVASVDPMYNGFGMDLDALAAKPQVLDSSLHSQPALQECSNSLDDVTYGDHTSINMPSSYPILDNAPWRCQFDDHLMEMPNILPQDDIEHFLWDMDSQRQKHHNHDQYGFTTNLCSFH